MLAFCQNTFAWGDYVPDVWDKWLTDKKGQLLVGAIDGQPVGLVHVAFIDAGVAWMEGMRVHPDFRRQGIASAMDAAARAFARARGARWARLATSVKNIPAQATLAKEGYTRVARYNEWEAAPARLDFSATRVATPNDAERVLQLWHASSAHAASALLPDRDWHWCELTHARLLAQMDAGQVRWVDGGFALLLAAEEGDWSRASLHALAGDEKAIFALARAARGEARYRGYSRLEAILINHPALNAALERAGYRREGGMFIYEQALR